MKIVKRLLHNLPAEQLRVSLCERNSDIAREMAAVFRDVDAVEVVEGDLLDLDCDAIVSPANSFGEMSGGIDKQIDEFYDREAQRAAMQIIRDRFLGELPVGMGLVVEMKSQRFPFLVLAPTMRIPGNVGSTLNAYLAMRGALVAIVQHNSVSNRRIQSVAFPGLCTGVGGMSFAMAVHQMRAAYDNVIAEGWRDVIHPALAPFAGGTGARNWKWSEP